MQTPHTPVFFPPPFYIKMYVINFVTHAYYGKTKMAEDVIEVIDDEKKLVKFRVVKGDILDSYKSFSLTCQVHSNDDDHFVTWTLEYEKLSEEIPEPLSYLQTILDITKEMENYHAKK
nr:kirola-like [Ipomoea batatas]